MIDSIISPKACDDRNDERARHRIQFLILLPPPNGQCFPSKVCALDWLGYGNSEFTPEVTWQGHVNVIQQFSQGFLRFIDVLAILVLAPKDRAMPGCCPPTNESRTMESEMDQARITVIHGSLD